MPRLVLALLLFAATDPAPAPLAADPARAVECFTTQQPMALPADMTTDDARRWQDEFVRLLAPRAGGRAGYKAALTNPAAQARFGVDHPVLGILCAGMLASPGATLSLRAGVALSVEADLVVRVGDEGINEAETDQALLAALDAVYPFLEIPDLALAADQPLNAVALTAINAGSRFGVLGDAVRLAAGDDPHARLAAVRVRLTDSVGGLDDRGTGAALLGHPVHVVRWIRDEVMARGGRLQAGDLLSLGSMTPPRPVRGATTVTARYEELDPDGPVEIAVAFIP